MSRELICWDVRQQFTRIDKCSMAASLLANNPNRF
ncbi:Uncharacterised protein [Vibrio cholerae]|nr:Uncharacterised protein [Vibrio cholerae]